MKKKLFSMTLSIFMGLSGITVMANDLVAVPISSIIQTDDTVSIHQINMDIPITRAEFITTIILTTEEKLPPIMDTHYALPAMERAEALGLIDLEKYPMETWSQLMPAEEKLNVLSKAMANSNIDMGKVYTALNQVLINGVTLNEKEMNLDGLLPSHSNGKLMLPLRKVAEAMGFEITWNKDTYTATLSNSKIKSDVQVGFDNYYYTSEVAIGMSQPFSVGAAPRLIEGSVYVPVDFFSMFAEIDINNNQIHFTLK